jgi:hypothetical protein
MENVNIQWMVLENLVIFFKKKILVLGMMTHACNPATWEVEVGGLQFKASLGKEQESI